ncbi:hypothetical protein MT325_m429L [Paramecium bursaria chlorella virus MT325]|uniref:Uncharacterized protein m429L n=1 Tax=Paramecium bursaria Chlorella virus MT325 TaxID=346932 RepID=A7IUF9_PBCVM|nr:hypothetical protein MT325_m429L [Paramecium bursaria chlorella virus MT325]
MKYDVGHTMPPYPGHRLLTTFSIPSSACAWHLVGRSPGMPYDGIFLHFECSHRLLTIFSIPSSACA